MTTVTRVKPKLPHRRIPRLRAVRPYDPASGSPDFARRMREAYDRLRTDPAAWAEWMEECASIDPLLVSPAYWDAREQRLADARNLAGPGS